MKTPVAAGIFVVGMMLPASGRATIIPLSGQASVQVSGYASVPTEYGGDSQSYGISVSTTGNPFTGFANAVTGNASATITIDPPFELYFGKTLQASSSASQAALLTGNQISINASATAYTAPYSQVGGRASSAQSSTTFSFSLDVPAVYELSGLGNHFQSAFPSTTSAFTTSLVGPNGIIILDYTAPPAPLGAQNYSWSLVNPLTGYLGPGTYSFVVNVQAMAGLDPLGETGSGNVSLNLQLSNVPDEGETAWLLLAGILACACARRRSDDSFPAA